MPNYRQKNKKNKNKNRQKNQQQPQQLQQQQQQNQPENKSKNQNQKQQQDQPANSNRQSSGKQDNQSQGRSRREQSNQQQLPKSPKSPTPTATQRPVLVAAGEPYSTQQHASSEDAREVDSTAPAAALIQCDNLNSNDPSATAPTTTGHQAFRTAVVREECKRVEHADAQFSDLDNTEATHIETAHAKEEGVINVETHTMGNKDSKLSITNNDATTMATATATPTETPAAGSDLCGVVGPDRTIVGARELETLQPVSKTQMQMAKVIVHRIVRAASDERDELRSNIVVDKVGEVATVDDKINGQEKELTAGQNKATNKPTAVNDRQIGERVLSDTAQRLETEVAQKLQQSKVIVHKIKQEEERELSAKQAKAFVHTIQQEGSKPDTIKQCQTSEAAEVKIVQNEKDAEANVGAVMQQPPADQKSAIVQVSGATVNSKGMSELINDDSKVIIHHIQLESTSPIDYRVELPDADSPTYPLGRSKQSLLGKHIVQIQELSDESASECNDNPPVISEAESETESTASACAIDYAQAIRTLSPDAEDNYEFVRLPQVTPTSQEQQELKQRRAQKRVALETHFLPQLLSPRYLDSIVEENSDMSDTRSDCSENPLMTTLSGDDLRDPSAAKVRKANEIFPRSNLDFSRRHAKKQLGALPKQPLSIREEPVAMVVAAKIMDATTPVQECCVRLSSEHTPESEAAEVIYLSSSASSSLSDLVELEPEVEGDDERDDSCRSMVDLDTDVHEIITKPASEECATGAAANTLSESRESTPVNQSSTRLSEKNETQKMLANNNRSVEQITAAVGIGTIIGDAGGAVNGAIINPIESRIYENLRSLQLLAEPSSERALSSGSCAATKTVCNRTAVTTTSESETETEMSSDTTTERCEYLRSSDTGGSSSSLNSSSIEVNYPPATTATSDSLNVDPAVLLENIELEMNSVRDILNSHTIEPKTTSCGHVYDTRSSSELNISNINSAKKASPSPPPIPPPPTNASASDFHSDFTGFQKQSDSHSTAPPIPSRVLHESTTAPTHTTEQKSPPTTTPPLYTANSALTSLSLLMRQESVESHCSDSTQHSQCTAINVGSRPPTDHELTPPLTATSPISDDRQQQQRHCDDWKYTSGEHNAAQLSSHSDLSYEKDASIKKLRLLCTETLASMPYGEQVLEELATVAQNIGELQAKTPTQRQEQNLVAQQQQANGTTMPYPLPQLPHIRELQLSIADDQPHVSEPPQLSTTLQRSESATSTIATHIVAGGPVSTARDLTTAQALHSPPPPPVPSPPSHYSDAPWMGVPTSADPSVLVCLSPAQQRQLTTNASQPQPMAGVYVQQPDQLLDAHQKFLERRGYHEFTEEQVKTLNSALQHQEQQILKTAAYMKKLRKSLTPPPPVPPPPVPSKSAETAAKAQNQARTGSTSSSIGSSATSSQRAYDAISHRNANEETASTFANGEEQQQQQQHASQSEQKRPHNTGEAADFSADAIAVSVAGSSSQQQTSSLENNSRQSSAAAAQGGAPTTEGKQSATSADTRQYSNANASESTNNRTFDFHGGNNHANSRFPSSADKMQGVESDLAKMFPAMDSSNIFDSNRKRFSNIETSTFSPGGTYCAQLQSTLPKRYSNIETHSYEAKKRMENGKIVYDYNDSRHERHSDGEQPLASPSTPSLLHFPVRESSKETLQYPLAGGDAPSRSGNGEIMSAIKLNTTENAKTTTAEIKTETKEKANGINMTNFAYPGTTSSATTTTSSSAQIREEHIKNSHENGGTVRLAASSGVDGSGSGSAYEEFRQRAKATAGAFGAFGDTPATAPALGESNSKHSAFNFQHEKLFKDFDTLSQQLHTELEEGKAQREQREKSASLYDLSRSQWNFKDHFDQLKKQRHEHMQELEREIDRSMRSRHVKGWTNGGAHNATGRTVDIPIRVEQRNGNSSVQENGYAHSTGDRSSAPREQTLPCSYNIPIVLENGATPKVPPLPQQQYDTVDDASRFRRAESMFDISENTKRQQPQVQQTHATDYERRQSNAANDWARYASDFGSSENITRPFAREVEICYQRQRPRTIRAPRLSASTNDLSSNSQSYDSYNAFNVHRSHAPMLQPIVQQQRSHHASCYSVLERDPNPTYISTTTRRGVSPAPVSPAAQPGGQQAPHFSPHAPERQRRASLPREIQEQQLKYISSKEDELRMEFERLQSERRRLMDELNGAPATLQMPQHPMRDIYRPLPKLPTLTEDEVFRQQMAEEWLNKVAEREERRLQKIIKISKVNEAQHGHHQPPAPPLHKIDISDEFLKRVHERRTKLAMPADSDWESGAESQPVGLGHASESDAEVPPVKVIEGKAEADLRQLPRHLREFARFSNHNEEKINGGHKVVHQEEERRQEANANSMSSAVKKSSMVKTVKIVREPEIMGQSSQRLPSQAASSVQQRQPQGHRRTTSGGEQVTTRRSHLATSTSNTQSSYETHAKLQHRSSGGGGGGGVGGVVDGAVSVRLSATSPVKRNSDHHQHSHKHHQDHHHTHPHQGSSGYNSLSHPPAPHMRTCKKTRFVLEPNRRSWSESDLLKEIDSELKLAKGFLYANGVWTPGTQTPYNTSLTNLNDIYPKGSTPTPPPPPQQQSGQPVWTPQPSPSSGRKEFRPVRFESPTLPRRYVLPQSNGGTPPVPPPWNPSTDGGATNDAYSSYAAPTPRSAYSYTNLSTPTTTIGSTCSTNYCDSIPSEASLLNHVGAGAGHSVADKIKTFERSASTSALYSPAARRRHDTGQPFYKPNEVIFKVKHEYMSEPESEHDRPRKMAQLGRRQVDGIGPVTNDGMPIILRSEVKEPHQHEWYKRLYQTIHKQKSGDDYVIRYKCQRARPQLKSTGYQSEPEPNHDSDYSTVKYRTLDRRRLQSVSSATNVANRNNHSYQDDKLYGTMPNPIKSAQNTYKNQPGRIEDYVTGRSSISEKERKEWWDEVMDIFNGCLREHRFIPRIYIEFADDASHLDQTKLSPQYTEGNLSRALAKESGYTSDSNLVFRKRELPQASPLSPVEQKQVYKSVQAGGEPPLYGFRKPAPERPKEYLDYTHISPTLTRIRVISASTNSAIEHIHTKADTIAAPPPVQQAPPRGQYIKVHHQAKMFTPSFIPIGGKRSASAAPSPPQPPNRKSSCQKVSAKASPARPPKPSPVIPKRHEQCFQSPNVPILGANKYATITIRKHARTNGTICRSKSAGAVSSLLATTKASTDPPPRALSICRGDSNVTDGGKARRLQQHTRFRSISPARAHNRITSLRQSSRSPVAFGRSISKERTFAEEKKRLENSLPTGFTNFEASTNILRDPSLKSPQEVKQAVRSYATCVAHLRSKSLPRLREASKRPESSSVSTTVRHTMCFPQAKIFDCAKAMRKTLTRSKSPRPKAVSTVSLTRTDSTYSIESTPNKSASRNKIVASGKKVAEPKSKQQGKAVKPKLGSRQPESVHKGHTILKPLKARTAIKSQNLETAYCSRDDVHTIPRSGFKSLSLHQSRSLSPKRYYHLEEYNARLDDYDEIDHSYVDDLLWQYERGIPNVHTSKAVSSETAVGDIACLESNTPGIKSRKFSPTREIRVPQEPRSLQVNYSKTEAGKPGADAVFLASSEHAKSFSPTREVRVPKLPPSLQPSQQRSKSPKTVRDIARPESPAVCERTRKFSPTREIRVPQLPPCSLPSIPKSASAQTIKGKVRMHSQSPSSGKPSSRKFSPTREVRVPQQVARSVRSPSRRRIDTYRANAVREDKVETGNVIRASSLSSADDRSRRGLYLCGDLAHSATSLENYERHSPTCRYRNNSERFTDLNRFYSTLERVGQLERATSLLSFKPIRRDSEPLDFEDWRKIRGHERAEKELNYLVGKLKQDQRTKDFVFRSKDVEDVKWRKEMDFGLHSKDKSVEDLRYEFEQKNIFADYEQQLLQEYDGSREYVRPYWRRNTVADLASSLEGTTQPEIVDSAPDEELAKCQLSSHLVSTLSKDQILKITKQLNEIYASNAPGATDDHCVITVDANSTKRAPPSALKVRCNSTMTRDDLLQPTISKKQAKETTPTKGQNKGKFGHEMTNVAGQTKGTRSSSPVYMARETRGAVAAKNADVRFPKPPPIPKMPDDKLDFSHECGAAAKSVETREITESAAASDVRYEQCNGNNYLTQGDHSSIAKEHKEKITQKIQYFEEKQYDEPPKTIYHAREDSSPDEAEVMRAIEENIKTRACKTTPIRQHKELSNSLTDLKDIFGERHTARVNFHMHPPPERPPDVIHSSSPVSPRHECMEVSDAWYDLGELTPNSSIEMLDAHYRSRSLSPESQASSSYLCRVHTGDVRKMKQRFESFGAHDESRCHFFGVRTLRKVRSDPELKQFEAGSKDTLNTELMANEYGDTGFEQRVDAGASAVAGRGRTLRRVISPACVKDRLMPHIDIISKTAALKDVKKIGVQQSEKVTPARNCVVERIRSQYERSLSPPISGARNTTSIYISNSSPDIPQAAAISPHLSADWIAHKYPSPTQNAYKGNGIGKTESKERTSTRIAKILRKLPQRSSSASPPRPPKTVQHGRDTTLSKTKRSSDVFANQKFDPKKHQPKARYVPDGAEASERKRASSHPRCGGNCEILKSAMAVSFQDDGNDPPVPPKPREYRAESPNRYLESDVNIHFKTPIRHEYKQAMSDEELAQRQAEQMQKLYQEERRRKYLLELQDMNARRHTDNFTPTQKSPIPLNRYDDFQSDLAPPKSPNTITTRAAARALYSFQGQNARELSFKKGDIIYIRRQIDRNWYEGEHNAMIGLLPVSYVEVVNKEIVRQQPKKPSEGQARAKYNFQAQSGIELSLNKGELVTLTRRVDENWFEGKIANRKGIFPVSYVDVLTDIGAEDIAARTVTAEQASVTNLRPSLDTLRTNINNEFNLITKNGHQPPNGILKETKHHNNKIDALHVDTHSEPIVYRALYKYRPQNSDEMELLEGDIVHVLEICDDGWFVGTSQRTGCFGTFPGNYVERAL